MALILEILISKYLANFFKILHLDLVSRTAVVELSRLASLSNLS